MYLQLAEGLERGRNKRAFRPKNRPSFTVPKNKVIGMPGVRKNIVPYVYIPKMNIRVREDILDDIPEEELENEGVELSAGGRQRRKQRKQDKHEQKIAKKGAKTEKKLAKADKKRSEGEAKKLKGQAKIDKANAKAGKGWKDTAGDIIDTAGTAFQKYQDIKGGVTGGAGNENTEPSFFDKNKGLIIGGGIGLAALLLLPKLMPKRA